MIKFRLLFVSIHLWMAVCWPSSANAQVEEPVVVLDLVPGIGSSCPHDLTRFRGQLIFGTACTVDSTLWISNGTVWGTHTVQIVEPGQEPVNSIRWPQVVHNISYFNGHTQERGFELWRTDGTNNGTYMVIELAQYPPFGSADPIYLTAFHDQLYFFASSTKPTSEMVYRLWRSDGTAVGTVSFGIFGRNDNELLVVGDRLFFTAESWDDPRGKELYQTNGTLNGTILVRDIVPGIDNSSPAEFTEFQSMLYFRAQTPESGGELWRSDGTSDGTIMIKDAVPGVEGSFPRELTSFNDQLLYAGVTPTQGYELWRSDGTADGTLLVKDIYSGTESSFYTQLFPFNDTVVFGADDGIHGAELWQTDGTITGTIMLKDIRPGIGSSSPAEFVRFGDQFYFVADDGRYGREIWRSDGTADGTVLLSDLYPGRNSSLPSEFTVVGDRMYFAAEDKVHGRELWTIGPPIITYPTYIPVIISGTGE